MSNLPTVQSIYAAFGRGDVPAILEQLSDDVVWEYQPISTQVPYLQARRGRAGAGEFFRILGSELQVTKFTVNHLLETTGLVVAVIDIDATVKRSGKKFSEVDEVHLWHFDAKGRVAKFRHCADTHQHHLAWG